MVLNIVTTTMPHPSPRIDHSTPPAHRAPVPRARTHRAPVHRAPAHRAPARDGVLRVASRTFGCRPPVFRALRPFAGSICIALAVVVCEKSEASAQLPPPIPPGPATVSFGGFRSPPDIPAASAGRATIQAGKATIGRGATPIERKAVTIEWGATIEREAWIMGTRARVRLTAASRSVGIAASEAALLAMTAAEELLSTWRNDSALSRLNTSEPGTVATPPPGLASVLAELVPWTARTGGAFHPAVGALIDAWDLRGGGRVPSESRLRAALAATGDAGMRLAADGAVTRRQPAAWLDAGAFGKGAGLRSARDSARVRGAYAGVLDLGGQLVVFGHEPVEIAVAHPNDRLVPVMSLKVANASVATSGQSERSVGVGTERLGHILDPRTGLPAPPWGSVTVVAADPLVADVLATALYVLGPADGLPLAESLDGVAALFLSSSSEGSELRVEHDSEMRSLVRDPTRHATDVPLRPFVPLTPPTSSEYPR